MQDTFRNLLHEYRVETFKATHSPDQTKERTEEALKICREALHQVYKFHFHNVPDAQKAELLNLVHDYAVEALLPPIIERIIERELVLEKKHALGMKLVEQILEALSNESGSGAIMKNGTSSGHTSPGGNSGSPKS